MSTTTPMPPAPGPRPEYQVEIGEGAEPMTLAELQAQSTKAADWLTVFGVPQAGEAKR